MFNRLPVTLLFAAAGLAGCKSDRPAAEAQPASAAPAASEGAPAAPPQVTITATDYKLELPASIPAGVVALHLVNHGKELHQAQLVRLDDGKTADDVMAAAVRDG